MKKLYALLFLLLPLCSLWAQNRTCATMSSLETRMKKDPSLKQIHLDYEKNTEEWIRTHSASPSNFKSNSPLLPGFHPTTDPVADQQQYAALKRAFYQGLQSKKESLSSPLKKADTRTHSAITYH